MLATLNDIADLSVLEKSEHGYSRKVEDVMLLGRIRAKVEDPYLTVSRNTEVPPNVQVYVLDVIAIKDGTGAMKCVMFKSAAMRLRFRPENGMQVIAMGSVTVYVRDGVYQLYCTGMVMDGIGDLYAAFEQLKAKLASEGRFDPAHKKPIPKYPGRIGIVTSSAGAAVHDMLRILRKRYPLSKVFLLPVRVQGAEAPPEIAAAIRYANHFRLTDLLIVGRGGGCGSSSCPSSPCSSSAGRGCSRWA